MRNRYIRKNLHEEVPNTPYIERNNAAESRFVRQRIVDQLCRRRISGVFLNLTS